MMSHVDNNQIITRTGSASYSNRLIITIDKLFTGPRPDSHHTRYTSSLRQASMSEREQVPTSHITYSTSHAHHQNANNHEEWLDGKCAAFPKTQCAGNENNESHHDMRTISRRDIQVCFVIRLAARFVTVETPFVTHRHQPTLAMWGRGKQGEMYC